MLRGKLPPSEDSGRIKRVADEGEPVVVVPVIREPAEVGIAFRIVQPRVRNLLVAREGNVFSAVCATAH